jgi:hypothetical protein
VDCILGEDIGLCIDEASDVFDMLLVSLRLRSSDDNNEVPMLNTMALNLLGVRPKVCFPTIIDVVPTIIDGSEAVTDGFQAIIDASNQHP